MKRLNFTHFRVHTEESENSSLINIDNLIIFAKKKKLKNLSVSNLNDLSYSLDFYSKCLKEKIKPIIGCEIIIESKINFEDYKLLFLIKNKLGYINLSKMLSRASIYNKIKNKIKMHPYWFKSNLRKGLILITGSKLSDIGFSIINNKKKLTNKYLNYWKKIYKNNLYLEIQRTFKNRNTYLNNKLILISNKYMIPIVATHNIYFFKKQDFFDNEVKSCIIKNKTINIKKFNFNRENYYYDAKKMTKLFKDIPESLKNTYIICNKCNINIDLNKIKLPYYIKNNFNNNKYILYFLKFLIKKKRIKKNNKLYFNRLLKECKVTISLGVIDYFLIIYNLIKWTKKKYIIKGPGRGSCSASLISYLLGITDFDPIKYNLVFERFLNTKRISIPDFDIDFSNNKKDLIIKYVKFKYGINKIFQILTINKITIKNSLRDIGRALNYNYNFINNISKSIDYKLDNYKELLKKNFEIKDLIKKSLKFEGFKKNLGMHAAGLSISFNNFYFNFYLKDNNNFLTTCYDKNNLEKIGLIKIDFLGLTTLNIIRNIKRVNNFDEYSIDNKISFYYLKKGDTNCIFQLEGFGIKKSLIQLKLVKFDNIISLISLYRPGPLNIIKNFYYRKLNITKVFFIDKKVKKLLKETHGLVIYQEQVIFITKIIAKFSLERSDILRIAMSKKNINQISNERKDFCLKSDLSFKKSNIIFNLLEKFSGYGFNKSHATAYSYISYYMINLKIFYNLEFFVANMSYHVDNQFKINNLILECKKNDILVLPININLSDYNFSSYKKLNLIRFGLKSIKGLGENTIYEIINLRKKKKFSSFENFYERISNNINYRLIELLISSGAFNCFNYNKAFIVNIFNNILDNYSLKRKIFFSNPLFKNKKNKSNKFWNYYTEILEEYNCFKFNNFYNPCFIFSLKLKEILDYNDEYFWGFLIKIQEKNFTKDFIFLSFLNEEYLFQIKLKKIIFKKKKSLLYTKNLLIIKCIKNKNYYYVKRILDIKIFFFMYKKWFVLDWE